MCAGPAQHRVFAGEGDRGDERLGHAVVGIRDGVDRIGDGGQEALGFTAHQRLDHIVAAGVAAVRGHPGHARSTHHIFDRNALQANGSGFHQGGIEDALAGAVRRIVDASARTRTADHLDELRVDHGAAASRIVAPAARFSASCA